MSFYVAWKREIKADWERCCNEEVLRSVLGKFPAEICERMIDLNCFYDFFCIVMEEKVHSTKIFDKFNTPSILSMTQEKEFHKKRIN